MRVSFVRVLPGFPVGSALDHRSLPPEFESWHGHIWRVFHLWLCFITVGGCSAHLAHHVHKSGHKTSIIIMYGVLQNSTPCYYLSLSLYLCVCVCMCGVFHVSTKARLSHFLQYILQAWPSLSLTTAVTRIKYQVGSFIRVHLRGPTGSVVGHRSQPPEFKSQRGPHVGRTFHLSRDLWRLLG